MADKQIGVVVHYFGKIGVAVVKLDKGGLSVGDTMKIVGHGNEFSQEVTSMQVEHESIKTAKKGEEFGLKVDQKTKKGDIVYKVEE